MLGTAAGMEWFVIVNAAVELMESDADTEAPCGTAAESVTMTENAAGEVVAVVGVPKMRPVEVFRERPAGREPVRE